MRATEGQTARLQSWGKLAPGQSCGGSVLLPAFLHTDIELPDNPGYNASLFADLSAALVGLSRVGFKCSHNA